MKAARMSTRFSCRVSLCLVLFVLLGPQLISLTPSTQAQSLISELKAQYIERFAGFIEWPAGSVSEASSFVIGVIGRTELTTTLGGLARRTTIKGKSIEVLEVSNLGQADTCQILFIARSERGRLTEILGQIRRRPVLTVGDTDGFANRGVMINFLEGESLRFEINQVAAETAGLRLSEKLLDLGDKV